MSIEQIWDAENKILNNIIKNNQHRLENSNFIDRGYGIERVVTVATFVKPYFLKICTNVKSGIYISENLYLPSNNVFKFTSPIAKLRFLDINDSEEIGPNRTEYVVEGKIYFEISSGFTLEKITVTNQLDENLEYPANGKWPKVIDYAKNKIDIGKELQSRAKPISDKLEESAKKQNNIEVIEDTFIPKMKSIATTLQKEQDEIMRLPIDQISFIYGPPGSGKTNVALHRVSYLLDELYKNEIPKIAFFIYQVSLQSYLTNVISELDIEDKLSIFTIDKWIRDCILEYLNSHNLPTPTKYNSYNNNNKHNIINGKLSLLDSFIKTKLPKIKLETQRLQEKYLEDAKVFVKEICSKHTSSDVVNIFNEELKKSLLINKKNGIKKENTNKIMSLPKDSIKLNKIFDKYLITKLSDFFINLLNEVSEEITEKIKEKLNKDNLESIYQKVRSVEDYTNKLWVEIQSLLLDVYQINNNDIGEIKQIYQDYLMISLPYVKIKKYPPEDEIKINDFIIQINNILQKGNLTKDKLKEIITLRDTCINKFSGPNIKSQIINQLHDQLQLSFKLERKKSQDSIIEAFEKIISCENLEIGSLMLNNSEKYKHLYKLVIDKTLLIKGVEYPASKLILYLLNQFTKEIKEKVSKDLNSSNAYTITNNQSGNIQTIIRMLNDFYKYLNQHSSTKIREINNLESLHIDDCEVLLYLLLKFNLIEKKEYDHIFVDEAQDFSEIRLGILAFISNNSMTLTGDRDQAIFINPNSTNIGLPINEYQIKTSHRVSFENIAFASLFLPNRDDIVNTNNVTRFSQLPSVYKYSTSDRLEDTLIKLLKDTLNNNPEQKILIVVPNKHDLSSWENVLMKNHVKHLKAERNSWDFKNFNVYLSTYKQIKGLEFDQVVVLNLDGYFAFGGQQEEKKRVAYTIITRAKTGVHVFLSANSTVYNTYFCGNEYLFKNINC